MCVSVARDSGGKNEAVTTSRSWQYRQQKSILVSNTRSEAVSTKESCLPNTAPVTAPEAVR